MRKPVLVCLGLFALVAVGASCQRGAACEASYPDFCIAPPPPDLDCRDVPHRSFRVRQPDPHHFDDDGDGRGCEPRPRRQ
jgi:micrococcal nuclease